MAYLVKIRYKMEVQRCSQDVVHV